MTTTQFDGRVALVTGAGNGIGRASALAFAAAGASVAVVDVADDAIAVTVGLIQDAGGVAQGFHTDVANEESVAELVASVVATYGRLDFAHNNAGISPVTGNVVACPKDLWDAVLSVDLTGAWLCLKYEIPAMLETAGGGAIVNTSSGVGLIGMPNQPAYVAAKHGVIGLTKAAALEFAAQGVRVNAVCPGSTLTEMMAMGIAAGKYTAEAMEAIIPMERLGDPDDIAQAVVWLCGDGASFVTGAILPVDGGTLAGAKSFGPPKVAGGDVH